MSPRALTIGVIGAGDAQGSVLELAFEVGRELALNKAILICGGLGGVMEAAARGARASGGLTIGILPTYRTDSANPFIEFPIATGMGEARNAIIVASSQAIIALEGEGGTLAEIGYALKLGRPVVALKAWENIMNLQRADTPDAAVKLALKLAGGGHKSAK